MSHQEADVTDVSPRGRCHRCLTKRQMSQMSHQETKVGEKQKTRGDHLGNMTPPSPTAVEISPDPNPSANKEPPPASFWSRLVNAANVVEELLAEWCGLNQSKYQWAVDEYMDRQLAGESQSRPNSSEAPNELHTQPISQQAMHVKFLSSISKGCRIECPSRRERVHKNMNSTFSKKYSIVMSYQEENGHNAFLLYQAKEVRLQFLEFSVT